MARKYKNVFDCQMTLMDGNPGDPCYGINIRYVGRKFAMQGIDSAENAASMMDLFARRLFGLSRTTNFGLRPLGLYYMSLLVDKPNPVTFTPDAMRQTMQHYFGSVGLLPLKANGVIGTFDLNDVSHSLFNLHHNMMKTFFVYTSEELAYRCEFVERNPVLGFDVWHRNVDQTIRRAAMRRLSEIYDWYWDNYPFVRSSYHFSVSERGRRRHDYRTRYQELQFRRLMGHYAHGFITGREYGAWERVNLITEKAWNHTMDATADEKETVQKYPRQKPPPLYNGKSGYPSDFDPLADKHPLDTR
jgi:hypothetical protein